MEKMQPKQPDPLGEKPQAPQLMGAGKLGIKETLEAIEAVRRLSVAVARNVAEGRSFLEMMYDLGREWRALQEALEGATLIPQELADLADDEYLQLAQAAGYTTLDIIGALKASFPAEPAKVILDQQLEVIRNILALLKTQGK